MFVSYAEDPQEIEIAGTASEFVGLSTMASRRTSLTLPNGVIAQYSYDSASRLTGITYSKGGAAIGNLVYTYDAAGWRLSIGGTLARTGLPPTLATASYNAANQQTAFGSQSLTYDLNGNLTSDGTNTYTWNARDQLASMSGPGLTASFQYDATGRRTSRTINGTTTAFLYDGANIVQEQTGGSASSNTLAGGLDESFSRTDASGAMSPLADALGTSVALVDSSSPLQTQYTYEPFGKTSASGAANATLRSTRTEKTMVRDCIITAIATTLRTCSDSSVRIRSAHSAELTSTHMPRTIQ